MEPEGLVSEASWNSFDVAMSTEESEMIAHLLGGHQLLHELDQDPSIEMPPIFWPDHGADQYYSLDETGYDPYYFSQGTSSTSTSSFSLPLACNGGCYLSDSIAVPEITTTPTTTVDFSSCHQFNEPVCAIKKTSSDEFSVSKEKPSVPALPPHQNSQATKKRIHGSDAEQPTTTNEKDGTSIQSRKKKARASAPEYFGDLLMERVYVYEVPKKGKNAQSKKAQKGASTGNEEDSNADLNGQSSSCYSSEDDSNASQELNGGAAPSANGKTRAGRRSATDPQSHYARKRRERINKRLRILQNLVPNGTKVDISTMLEEAVQYVKFLQHQIKLLSSDELWMYAPIAYNGINIGL